MMRAGFSEASPPYRGRAHGGSRIAASALALSLVGCATPGTGLRPSQKAEGYEAVVRKVAVRYQLGTFTNASIGTELDRAGYRTRYQDAIVARLPEVFAFNGITVTSIARSDSAATGRLTEQDRMATHMLVLQARSASKNLYDPLVRVAFDAVLVDLAQQREASRYDLAAMVVSSIVGLQNRNPTESASRQVDWLSAGVLNKLASDRLARLTYSLARSPEGHEISVFGAYEIKSGETVKAE